MKHTNFNMNSSLRWTRFPIVCLLVANLFMGCASETHIRKETVTTPTTPSSTTQTVVVDKETTKVEEHHGVIGGIFHVVGEVIALPFQLVADLFRAIF